MTSGAGPLQYASHSRVLGCVPLDCVSQCAIDSFVSRSQSCRQRRVTLQQAFNPPPACFAVSLLASLASSQIPTPGTTLAETPPLEVCPAKARSSLPCFPSAPLLGLGVPSPRVSPFRLECRMHCHCHPGTTERLVFQVFCPRPISPTRGFF